MSGVEEQKKGDTNLLRNFSVAKASPETGFDVSTAREIAMMPDEMLKDALRKKLQYLEEIREEETKRSKKGSTGDSLSLEKEFGAIQNALTHSSAFHLFRDSIDKVALAQQEILPPVATFESIFCDRGSSNVRNQFTARSLAGLSDDKFREALESRGERARRMLTERKDEVEKDPRQKEALEREVIGVRKALSEEETFKKLREDIAEVTHLGPVPPLSLMGLYQLGPKSSLDVCAVAQLLDSDDKLREYIQRDIDGHALVLKRGFEVDGSLNLVETTPERRKELRQEMASSQRVLSDPVIFKALRDEIHDAANPYLTRMRKQTPASAPAP